MTAVDVFAAAFNQLQDMKTILCFNDFRDLTVFQGKRRGFKFRSKLASAMETELATFLG